jgi:hypothetical protein
MEDKTIIAVVGITCVTIIEIVAMYVLHEDGILLTAVIGAIGVLAGHRIGTIGNTSISQETLK